MGLSFNVGVFSAYSISVFIGLFFNFFGAITIVHCRFVAACNSFVATNFNGSATAAFRNDRFRLFFYWVGLLSWRCGLNLIGRHNRLSRHNMTSCVLSYCVIILRDSKCFCGGLRSGLCRVMVIYNKAC